VPQPVKVACIEYPREAGKDEQYPWVCLWKAVWVADNILGARQQVNWLCKLHAVTVTLSNSGAVYR